MKTRTFLFLLVLISALVAFLPAVTYAQTRAAISFVDPDPLNLTIGEPGEFMISNDTASPVDVHITANVLDAEGKDASDVLQMEIEPTSPGINEILFDETGAMTATISAGRIEGFLITPIAIGDVQPTTIDTEELIKFTGRLTVITSAYDTVIHKDLVIQNIELESPTQVTPLVARWTQKHSYNPLGSPTNKVSCFENCDLPVDVPVDPENFVPLKEPLGYLVGDKGGVIEVSLPPDFQEMGGYRLTDTIELSLSGLNQQGIGSYTGDIDLLPDDKDKGAVTMTVNVSTHIWIVVLIVLAGVVIATVYQYWTGVLREKLKIEEEANVLKANAEKAQDKFSADSISYSFGTYTLKQGFISEIDEQVVNKLRKLASFPSLDEEDKKVVKENIEKIQGKIDQWKNYAGDLRALETSLKSIKTAVDGGGISVRPPDITEPYPAIYNFGVHLLTPVSSPPSNPPPYSENLSVSNFDYLSNQVKTTKSFGDVWSAMNRKASKLYDQLEAYFQQDDIDKTLDNEQEELLNQAMLKILGVYYDLWRIDDPANFDIEAQQRGLVEVEHIIRLLELEKKPGIKISTLTFTDDIRILSESIAHAKPLIEPTPEQKAEELHRIRTIGNWLYLLLSIFLVVFAFLELLYFDKVWGTWRDYIVALTFGITGKVVLDKFNDALSGLVSLKTDR